MPLIALKNRLDCDDISLKNRLQLAENILFSDEVPIIKKEDTILLWIIHNITNDKSFWPTLCRILHRNELTKKISSNSVTDETKLEILEAISKSSKSQQSTDVKQNISEAANLVLSDKLFSTFFKSHMRVYVKIFKVSLLDCQEIEQLKKLLAVALIFYTNAFNQEQFNNIFIEQILLLTCSKNQSICKNDASEIVSPFLQQTIFNYRHLEYYNRSFENILKKSTKYNSQQLPELLKVINGAFKDSKTPAEESELLKALNVIVHAFFTSFRKSQELLTEFSLILLLYTGFSIKGINSSEETIKNQKSLDFKLQVLFIILKNISNLKIKFSSFKVESLSACLNEIVIEIIHDTISTNKTLNTHLIQILDLVLLLDPNLIESNLGTFLMYVVLNNKSS